MPDTAGVGELWIRASRVLESCSICLTVEGSPPGWRAIIRRTRNGGPPIEASGAHLVEAILAAIDRAEAKGLVPGQG